MGKIIGIWPQASLMQIKHLGNRQWQRANPARGDASNWLSMDITAPAMSTEPNPPSTGPNDWFERLNRLARWLNPPSHEVTDDEMIDPGRHIRDEVKAPGKSVQGPPEGSIIKK